MADPLRASMLYDAFICHASEDKDAIVRSLAEQLRERHVEVWYDEFSLSVGDSIRRAIDRGLLQSRFAIVVLSPAFFAKNWPQYELDGLLDRELSGEDKVVLPVWHDVDHSTVARYSPSLAARFATQTSRGLEAVMRDLLAVIRPAGSPLLIARDEVIDWGLYPPVVTDPYWLEVAEASNRVPAYGAAIPEQAHWGRWTFPLPPREDGDAKSWGSRLAWTALQLGWIRDADAVPISVTTHPEEMLEFITRHPGLLETCMTFPDLAAEYAPQLTIRGYGGALEETFDVAYAESVKRWEAERQRGSISGSGRTTDGKPPTCDAEFALRDSHFGNYDSGTVAEGYFHADGVFGPPVAYHDDADHLFWLLSSGSAWLPPPVRAVLLDGMKDITLRWRWGEYSVYGVPAEERWSSYGSFMKAAERATEGRRRFRWTKGIEDDVLGRARLAKHRLSLPEAERELVERFRAEAFPETYLAAARRRRRSRAGKPRRPKKKSGRA